MYVGPAEAWAWPVLALLLMLSTGALGESLGQLRADPKQFEGAAALSLALLVVAICLLTPAVQGGINRVVFNLTHPTASCISRLPRARARPPGSS